MSNYLAKYGGILPRGNMTHFQESDKPLNFAQLLLMRQAAGLSSFLSICGHTFFARIFFSGLFIMYLNCPSKAVSQTTDNKLSKKIAMHVAGHVVAIYHGNRQKPFSPFFQILVNRHSNDFQLSWPLTCLNDKSIANSDDYRRILALPVTIKKPAWPISSEEMQLAEMTFEADIISLLAGPLAEAKYEAMCDGEPINPRLVNLNALHYYGGSSDLEMVNEYLECFITDQDEREKKISGLFLEAFSFINDRTSWLVITMLANYILTTRKNFIDYEEVVPYLLSSLSKLD